MHPGRWLTVVVAGVVAAGGAGLRYDGARNGGPVAAPAPPTASSTSSAVASSTARATAVPNVPAVTPASTTTTETTTTTTTTTTRRAGRAGDRSRPARALSPAALARANPGLTPSQIARVRGDAAARADADGVVFFRDPEPHLEAHLESRPDALAVPEQRRPQALGGIALARVKRFGEVDVPAAAEPALSSRPGAAHTIYLDFGGETLVDTAWNSVDLPRLHVPGLDRDGDPATFDAYERQLIRDTWLEVAEDFAPFAVDVTTVDPGDAAIDRTSVQDLNYGAHVIMGDDAPDGFDTGGAIGLGYVGTFDLPGVQPYYKHALCFYGGGQCASHEVGHQLGLSHDGIVTGGSSQPYHFGDHRWGPIMGGAGGYATIRQWSRGDYTGATNTENDLTLIAGNGLATVTDDYPASHLDAPTIDASTGATGLITAGTDVDVMRLTHPGGAFELRVQPDAGHGNLDVEAALLDATGALISGPTVGGAVLVQATNPATESAHGRSHGLASRLSAASLPAGTYHLTVRGSGAPATSTPYANLAYSSYGSLGRYVVTTGAPVVSLRAVASGSELDPTTPLAPTLTVQGESLTCVVADCERAVPYDPETVVTITADPLSNGWFFAGWAGDCAGVVSSTCRLRADRHLAVQAIYGPPRRFTVELHGDLGFYRDAARMSADHAQPVGWTSAELGTTTTCSPGGPATPIRCESLHPLGDQIELDGGHGDTRTLLALFEDGGLTHAWSEPGRTLPDSVIVDGDRTLVGVWGNSAAADQVIDATTAGSGQGTVVGTGSRTDCGAVCFDAVPKAVPLTFTADPAWGSSFHRWGGRCAGQIGLTCTITTDAGADAPYTAVHEVTAFFSAWTPRAPTIAGVVAGNGSAVVRVVPAALGPAAGQVEVSTVGGNQRCTTTIVTGTPSCTVTGLVNGRGYQFVAAASNDHGVSAPSAPSALVTPVGAPSPPRAVAAIPGVGAASLAWASPSSTGGVAVTRYLVRHGTRSWTTTSARFVVPALANNAWQTVSVQAMNAVGWSSAASLRFWMPPVARVTAKAVGGAGRLYLDVAPDKGAGYWVVRVQQRASNGTWATLSATWTTQGSTETRTIDLPRGTYRVVVPSRYGHLAGVSGAVTLTR